MSDENTIKKIILHTSCGLHCVFNVVYVLFLICIDEYFLLKTADSLKKLGLKPAILNEFLVQTYKAELYRVATNLNDLHMGTKSWWKPKVQDPVESGTQQHYNISLQ